MLPRPISWLVGRRCRAAEAEALASSFCVRALSRLGSVIDSLEELSVLQADRDALDDRMIAARDLCAGVAEEAELVPDR